jgi:hypothetical protein
MAHKVDHHVYIVLCCYNYEGSTLHSVHATKATAEAEIEKLMADDQHEYCDKHIVEVHEILP